MKVSFIVGVYNTSKYVERFIRSLAEQTLEDIEIVVIDDGSQDDSIEIIKRVIKEYPSREKRLSIYTNKTNKGISEGRRQGFSNSSGDYIIFVDSDDFVDVRMAEVLYNKAVETGADTVLCDFYRYYEGNARHNTIVPNGLIDDGDNVKSDIINRDVPPFIWCRIINRRVIEDHDFIWPKGNLGDDTVIGGESIYYSRKIAYVNEPLYYYRYNPTSVSHNTNEAQCLKNYNNFKINVEIFIGFLEKEGVADKYGRGVLINKLRTKNRLLPLTKEAKYRKAWWDTFPEINRILLFGNKQYRTSYKEWIWVAAILFGLYPRCKKKLLTNRLCPGEIWM